MYNDLFACSIDEAVKQIIEDKKKLEKMNEKNSVTIEKEKLDVGSAQRNIFEITKVYFDLLTSGKIKSDIDTTDVLKIIITLSNVFEYNHTDLNENDDSYESTIREFTTKKLLEFYGKDEVEEEKIKFCQKLLDLCSWYSGYRIKLYFENEDRDKVDHLEVCDLEHGNPIFKIMIESCKQ